MPRDTKPPLIQRVARQAHATFKAAGASSGRDSGGPPDPLAELLSLVTAVRAADLRIPPRKHKRGPPPGRQGPPPGQQGPPVTYMHICETDVFSMGVFLLRSGASIPLHDHPGMNGMLKVLYGKVKVRSFDKLEDSLNGSAAPPPFDPPVAPLQTASVWRSVLRSAAEYSETSGPCLLTPVRDNLHQIDAVGGPAAFLDILAPPYNPDDGRDCHYYRFLKTVTEGGTDTKARQETLGEEKDEEAWLLEIPQPEDFWCGGEPYPGPPVTI